MRSASSFTSTVLALLTLAAPPASAGDDDELLAGNHAAMMGCAVSASGRGDARAMTRGAPEGPLEGIASHRRRSDAHGLHFVRSDGRIVRDENE
jgi:hypothetical protein